MEVPQEIVPIGSHKDQQNCIMVKGKRTKRQRPQSPIPFTLAANSNPIRDSGDDYYYSITGQNNNSINNSNSSPATSAEVYQDSTEEEEDMANCLILLARGHYSREHHPPKQLDEDAKFTSRRYLEAATGTGGGKAGYYVYECKTCGRTFPSFQALGGHRASHKKPKNLAAEERRQMMMLSSSDDEDSHLPSLSLQLSNRSLYNTSTITNNNNHNNNKKSSKSHECSICGAEFASGQALGGHMRRHRGPLNTTTSTALSLTPMASDSEELHVPKKPINVSLDLDLNLPAPDDDHRHRGSNFPVASNQQQQKTQLVLSSSTLVDCHY